jgi:hypothetical protein
LPAADNTKNFDQMNAVILKKIRIQSFCFHPSWNVAGNVIKITIFTAFRTAIGLSGCYESKTALSTPPVSHTASWANISDESMGSGIAAFCAHPYILFVFHLFLLLCLSHRFPL